MNKYLAVKTKQKNSSDRCLILFFIGVAVLTILTVVIYNLSPPTGVRYMFVCPCMGDSLEDKAFAPVIETKVIENCIRESFVRHNPVFIVSRNNNGDKVVFEIYPKKYHRWWRDRYISVLTCIATNIKKKGYRIELNDNYSIPSLKIIVKKTL